MGHKLKLLTVLFFPEFLAALSKPLSSAVILSLILPVIVSLSFVLGLIHDLYFSKIPKAISLLEYQLDHLIYRSIVSFKPHKILTFHINLFHVIRYRAYATSWFCTFTYICLTAERIFIQQSSHTANKASLAPEL